MIDCKTFNYKTEIIYIWPTTNKYCLFGFEAESINKLQFSFLKWKVSPASEKAFLCLADQEWIQKFENQSVDDGKAGDQVGKVEKWLSGDPTFVESIGDGDRH